jgi:hypothetical protein
MKRYCFTIIVLVLGAVNISTIVYNIHKGGSSIEGGIVPRQVDSRSLEAHFLRGPLLTSTAADLHGKDIISTTTTQTHVIGGEPSSTASCGLYLARSTLPNGKLGLFAGIEYSNGVPLGTSDIMIPLGYDEQSDNGILVSEFGWSDWTRGYAAKAFPSLQEEGSSVESIILGHGSISNCVNGLANIDYSDVTHDTNFGTGHFPLQGSFTPYHGIMTNTIRKIDAFSEIFLSYCEDTSRTEYNNILALDKILDEYFRITDGKPIISVTLAQSLLSLIQARQDFNTSDTSLIVRPFLELVSGTKVSETFKKDLWRIIRETLDPASRKKLPDDLDELEFIRSSGGLLGHLDNQHTRSKKWLMKNGICLDNLRVGASTILEAGRGAFAAVFLPKDSIITPCPLIHTHQKDLEKKLVRKQSGTGQVQVRRNGKLIFNYCFGHEKSSVKLCPYGSASHLINHSVERANAKLRWSTSSMMNSSHLMLTSDELFKLKTPASLLFDIVATRDIHPGEEIFIDYGPLWQSSWEHYREEWYASFGLSTSHNSGADDLLLQVDGSAVVDHNNTFTACWYNFEDDTAQKSVLQEKEQPFYFSGVNTTTLTLFDWVYTSPPTWTLGGLYPCHIIKHEVDPSGHRWFTANITSLVRTPKTTSRIVQKIPRHAILPVNPRWSADSMKMTGPAPFRQYISIPDEIFPTAWMDL